MLEYLSRSLNIQLTCGQIFEVHTWKWFRFGREFDWLSKRKKLGSSSSVELHQRDIRLYGPQVRVMSIHIGMIGVFVSNLNSSMMRSLPRVSPGGRAQAPHGSLSMQAPGQHSGFACGLCVGESRTRSLKEPPVECSVPVHGRILTNRAYWGLFSPLK